MHNGSFLYFFASVSGLEANSLYTQQLLWHLTSCGPQRTWSPNNYVTSNTCLNAYIVHEWTKNLGRTFTVAERSFFLLFSSFPFHLNFCFSFPLDSTFTLFCCKLSLPLWYHDPKRNKNKNKTWPKQHCKQEHSKPENPNQFRRSKVTSLKRSTWTAAKGESSKANHTSQEWSKASKGTITEGHSDSK